MPENIFTCRIRPADAGLSMLDLLAIRFPYHDKKSWSELIGTGQVKLNGSPSTAGAVVKTGDTLTYTPVEKFAEPVVSTDVRVVFEDDQLLLAEKPAGTPVSRTGLIVRNTLVNLLRNKTGQDIHLLHRLDRETGGLVLCAKSRKACKENQSNLRQLLPGKYYLAITRGRLEFDSLSVETPLGTRDNSEINCQMWPDSEGKPCRTIIHTLAKNNDFSLVLAELKTGRKHQIRAHLAHLGHPLVGDKIYSHNGRYFLKRLHSELSAEDHLELGARHHALHAWAVELKPPGKKNNVFYSEHFSEDMLSLLVCFPDWREKADIKLCRILERNDAADKRPTIPGAIELTKKNILPAG